MKDGFNMTDATLDEKAAYVDKAFSEMMGAGAAAMKNMAGNPGFDKAF